MQKRAWELVAVGVCIVVAGWGGVRAQSGPVFRSGTWVVPLAVTVTDGEKRLVPDLVEDDFAVFDNDQPQRISIFENQTLPVTVVMLLDTSASMTRNFKLVRAAAEQFLIRLLPGDRGRVGAFSDKIQLSPMFTSNRDTLIAALPELDFGNWTRLNDAIGRALDALREVEGRRVVLVLTDGEDTSSKLKMDALIERARREDVIVYAIGLETEYLHGTRLMRTKPAHTLKTLAEETGGGYFELKGSDELGPTFTRVAKELHTQYVLGFSPRALDGKLHRLAVLVRRAGMIARARKTYLATERPGTAQ